MKKLLTLFLLLLAFSSGNAQQDPMYSMYMFNGLVLNPAYAGSREQLSATLIGRKQWAGIEKAPTTESFSVHAPSANLRNGYGLTVVNDQNGFTSNTNSNFAYAYRAPVGKEGFFSLGLQFGLNLYRVRFSEVKTYQDGDEAFSQGDISKIQGTAGTGVFFNTKRFYVGASVPNIIPNKLYNETMPASEARKSMHIFGTGGVILELGNAVKFKPSFLLKFSPHTPLALDANLAFLFAERLWLGGTWRPGDGFVGMIELNLGSFMRIGYAYDYVTNQLRPFAGSTHEIMLGFDMIFSKKKMVNPRYF